jgi:hypothetical protein
MIDESGCDKIDAAGVKFIKAYSVMTCSSKLVFVLLVMEEIFLEERWYMLVKQLG